MSLQRGRHPRRDRKRPLTFALPPIAIQRVDPFASEQVVETLPNIRSQVSWPMPRDILRTSIHSLYPVRQLRISVAGASPLVRRQRFRLPAPESRVGRMGQYYASSISVKRRSPFLVLMARRGGGAKGQHQLVFNHVLALHPAFMSFHIRPTVIPP